MATWQCDFFLLPRRKIVKLFGTVPQELEADIFSNTDWWGDYQPPNGYEKMLSTFLAQQQSWDDDLRTWGNEDGNRIDVWLRRGLVQEILIRIDAREIDLRIIKNVNDLSVFCDGVVLSANTKLFEPNFDMFLAEVHGSQAHRFVNNPRGFLDNIARENLSAM